VPIGPALAQQSFDPAQLRAMGIAFEKCCESLGLTDTTDRLTEIIASKIVEAAKAGESDPVRLYDVVMHWASAA
jgi:hypothetical protein